MGVVGPGSYWDGVVNGGVAGDEEFETMLSILDFPMESLEGDEFVEDWDATNSHCLGPISLDMLMTQPVIPREKIDTQSQHVLAETNIDAIDETSLQKQQPHYVEEASSSHVSPRKKFTGVHQTLSPVSVLESCRSSTRKSLLIKSCIKVPVRTRSKRVRPSGKNPWCLLSPLSATTSPTKRTSSFLKNEEGRRTSSQLSDATQTTEIHLNCQAAATSKCSHCGITQTPQWREGPMGRRTLCNACGVRYRSGRLFPEYRPAASPTFVPSLHSNSHRKVIEMRYKANGMQVKVKNPKDPAAGSGCHE